MATGSVTTELSREEIRRYSRHLVMPEVGLDGQRRLKAARVLVVGVGGLGSPAAMYLPPAGVGTLGLVDFDAVELSNLHRQILHGTPDVGRPKLHSAVDRLSALNPEVVLEPHETVLTAENALDLVRAYDVVVDGTDNFATRYLVNDACVLARRPNVYGSIFRFEGQAAVFAAPGGPCYRCLHPQPPPPGLVPTCEEGGVLGVLPGVIGAIQATEAIKLVLGIGEPLVGRLLVYDALRMRVRDIRLPRDPDCPVCGEHPTIRELGDYEAVCGPMPHRLRPGGVRGLEAGATVGEAELTPEALKARLEARDRVFVLDVREPPERAICHIPGSVLIPLGELPRRLGELPTDRDIVVVCRSGARSARAVAFLREHGFARTWNLRGGLLAWIDTVDPSQPKY